MTVLEVSDLCVDIPTKRGTVHAVRGLSYSLEAGRTLALVGESGCGKTVSALSLLSLVSGATPAVTGSALLDERDLLTMDAGALRSVRGKEIGVVFQDPLSALHPAMTVGAQLTEALGAHGARWRDRGRAEATGLLERVQLAGGRSRLDSYPHELSGGQRQRVMIAMAIAGRPRLLIADEPTTALDVTVQAGIIGLLRELQDELGMAMLLISHDLGVVGELAHEVAVVYAGQIVEQAPTEELFDAPQHPYTWGLLRARPRLQRAGPTIGVGIAGRPPSLLTTISGCAFAPRCAHVLPEHLTNVPPLVGAPEGHAVACLLTAGERAQARREDPSPRLRETRDLTDEPIVLATRGLTKRYPRHEGTIVRRRIGEIAVVDGVELDLRRGEALAIVGESGCGKTTTARMLLGLVEPSSGEVEINGRQLADRDRRDLAHDIQIVFQDPYASLNPRRGVGDSIADPVRDLPAAERHVRVAELLELVGLDPSIADRTPASFSGGERQRIAIARALAASPSILIADEPVTSLDVSVQAQVLALLERLQRELGLALLIIAHDLAVVSVIADRVAVMADGKIVETGPTRHVLDNPAHDVTRRLLAAQPRR